MHARVPPRAGGGMAAGKSAVRKEISRTRFWQRHGAQVVVVEADALKVQEGAGQESAGGTAGGSKKTS